MRIGLSSTTFEPGIARGKIDGIGMSTKNLYEEYKKLNLEVTPFYYPQKMREPVTTELPNSQSLLLPYMWSTITSLVTPGFSLYRGLEKHIDIFHTTDHMVPKLKNIPIVATINDSLMFKHPEWHSVRFAHLKKFARKQTLNWANHFITISQTMVQEAVEFAGVKEEKISVVHLGVSPWWSETVSVEEKAAVLKKFNLPSKFVLFTGTLQQKKNLPRLIAAYLELPLDLQAEYPLVVVGRAGWGMEESLTAIQNLTDKKRGHWLKYVSIDELRVLFQATTAYLHPSLHEGFGLTLLEAFASKTPVLTSNVAALPEIAGDAAYLVDPYSTDEIRDGMKALLTDSSLREQLVMKGNRRVQDFSWEKCARETLKVYQTVL
ncbi:MAG: glycosyltransferase family 1 protein [Gammaproteobacteria bacterium]|nr:glycosyltransferase family 1 protein [Gammaproteobacteria bacterium]